MIDLIANTGGKCMKELSRSVSLKCRICGNDQFSNFENDIEEFEEISDETILKCSDCGRKCSKKELLEDNKHIIDSNIEDIKEEALKQLDKELNKIFK